MNYMDKYLLHCSPNSLPDCYGYNEGPMLSHGFRCFSMMHVKLKKRGKKKPASQTRTMNKKRKMTMGREYPN